MANRKTKPVVEELVHEEAPYTTELKVFKLNPDAETPAFATGQAACFDLRVCLKNVELVTGYNGMNQRIDHPVFLYDGDNLNHVEIGPRSRALLPTGLIFDIPEGFSLRIHPRSGLSLKQAVMLGNCEGVVDSDYVEETFVMIYNGGNMNLNISDGMRIAQAELVPVTKTTITQTEDRPEQKTDRVGGFGSTGE